MNLGSLFSTRRSIIDATVVKPSISSPPTGTNISSTPTFSFSQFSVTNGYVDTLDLLQVQISTDSNFSTNIYEIITSDSSNLTLSEDNSLPSGETVYVRIRQKGLILTWSVWSDTFIYNVI